MGRYTADEIVEKGMAAMTTSEIPDEVRKAFTTADFSGEVGLMLPESSNRFLRKTMLQPTLLGPAGGVSPILLKSRKQNIDRINITGRLLETLEEDVDFPSESKPSTDQIVLETFEYGGMVPASYTLLEDVLEGKMSGGDLPDDSPFIETIQDLMIEAVARDLEEILLLSDTSSLDTTLDEFDGGLILPSNSYDHGSAPIDAALFEGMLAELPSEWLQQLAGLRFLVGPRTNLFLRAHLGKKGTPLGDRALTSTPDGQMYLYGVPVVSIGKMPETLGASSDEGKALLLHPKNFRAGIWRRVMLEVEKNKKKRRYEFYVSLRAGMKYEEPEGVVVGHSFKVAAA